MKIQWRLSAVEDLSDIHTFIAEHNPAAAEFVVQRVLRAIGRLEAFPDAGRPGSEAETRELVVPGLPCIVVYQHEADGVTIVAVFHGAQQR
jgi:toxin ParE1/3/4